MFLNVYIWVLYCEVIFRFLLCRYLLEGKNIENACLEVSKNRELNQSWKQVENAKLSPDGYVYNVVHSALHFIKNKSTLEDSIKFSGKANYSSIIFSVLNELILT